MDNQHEYMDAALQLATAVQAATQLGFTIAVNGGNISIIPWSGAPLTTDTVGDSLFESDYILGAIDWMEGVAYGRCHSAVPGVVKHE